MARICDQCGRGALKGNTRSHSNIATIKHRQINLQIKTIGDRRLKICANCIKTMAKQKLAVK